jgi:hypothetical protein
VAELRVTMGSVEVSKGKDEHKHEVEEGNPVIHRTNAVIGKSWSENVSKGRSVRDIKRRDPLSQTKTNLLSMLRTQSGYVPTSLQSKFILMVCSFGSAVGAPIVFFAGGFAYTSE